ncbi:hypothetical protein H0H92_006506 [Tricholoma furcatifolium]|nr:hypothetical protein H0H92_006506 [Tricholoma furcatifolium]
MNTSLTVNGMSYSATHPDQNMAREMAAGSALRGLEEQFRQGMQGPSLYQAPGPQPVQAQPRHYHATGSPQEHYRMELNNMANARGLLPVTYENEQPSGPQNKPMWSSTVYVAGINGGTGYGNSKGAAREQAARRAIDYLLQRGYELARRPR